MTTQLWKNLQELLTMKVIVTVPKQEEKKGFYSPLFLVKKPNGTLRLIINLRRLNKNIKYKYFKMESVKTATPLIPPDAQMCTIDLKDAYYHVPIHKNHQKFLRFAVESPQGKVCHFQFRALPFGISSAPRTFTKVMAEVTAFLRKEGISIIPYLDDLLIVADSTPTLLNHRDRTIRTLENLGWIINLQKSHLVPQRETKFLGVILDSRRQASFLPQDKRESLISSIEKFQKKKSCSVRSTMRLLGRLTACLNCVSWSQLHTRTLQAWSLKIWDKNLEHLDFKKVIPLEVKNSLNWWKHQQHLEKGILWNPIPVLTIQTDASSSGWGAVLPDRYLQGSWSPWMRRQSSNLRELSAVWETLKRLPKTQVKNIRILSDNVTTVAYLRRQGGTRSSDLMEVTKKIFSWAENHLESLIAVFLKGAENQSADFLSREKMDPHEWSLNREVFLSLTQKWGFPSIDLFASKKNTQIEVFFSISPKDNPLGLDALSQSWKTNLAYAFPPFPLISRTLQKIQSSQTTVILVAPFWPKKPWFPLLLKLAISGPIFLPCRRDLLHQGPLLHPDPKFLNLAAWLLKGNCS
ncbi:hypothetical protein GDO81_026159 [Engystomops pustulosus]|uniref:ribonuclease H n=1 Tax=Engystomops pustulosus TaxID=76066 RepID=A0AAV6YIM8_ENGPU|nr:hypothetical protein GDO81_026159 [Engystomops pustulosus]